MSDFGKISPKYRAVLEAEGIEFEEGGHTKERILCADEIVKSPGIPFEAPIIKEVLAKHIPIISEIEFAGRYTDAKMVCITGSNGKTTTTMLIHHILRHAGIDASLAGNIGNSLAWQVARDPHKVYVVELSSFQLDNMYDFKADIAVIMNITPDHLDRYDHKMENYVGRQVPHPAEPDQGRLLHLLAGRPRGAPPDTADTVRGHADAVQRDGASRLGGLRR